MNESMIGHEMVLTRYIYIYIGNSNIRKKQPDIFISWGNSSSAEQTTLKGNFESAKGGQVLSVVPMIYRY